MQRLEDSFEDRICSRKNVVIPEAQNAKAIGSQESIATTVVRCLLNVLTSVQFNDDRGFEANEVTDIRANGTLPSKLEVT